MKHFIVVLLAVVSSSSVYAEFASLTKLRVLGLLDTRAENVGASVKANGTRFINWYKSVFESDDFPTLKGRARLHLKGYDGSTISPADIKDYFSTYPLQADEALLIYYNGHGAYGRGYYGGHYFAMSNGNIGDLELMDMGMTASNIIMFEDACSSYDRPRGEETRYVLDIVDRVAQARAYEALFFQQRGQFILRAASRGEYAWTGVFSPMLFDELSPGRITNFYSASEGKFQFNHFAASVKDLTTERFRTVQRKAIESGQYGPDSIVNSPEQVPSGDIYEYEYDAEYGKFRSSLGSPHIAYYPISGDGQVRVPYLMSGLSGSQVDVQVHFQYPNGEDIWFNRSDGTSYQVKVSQPLNVRTPIQRGVMYIKIPRSQTYDLPGFPNKEHKIVVRAVLNNTNFAVSPVIRLTPR